MNTEHIRKDWLFWVMVIGLASVIALLSSIGAAFVFRFFVHPPLEVWVGFGVVVGFMLFLFTLQKFGVRIDLGIGPF